LNTDTPWFRKRHWQILAGIVLGLGYGVASVELGWHEFTADWIAPWGVIFLNLLKIIAVPLVVLSLVAGVASLGNLADLSRIGGRTIVFFLATTIVAALIGLAAVDLVRPGRSLPPQVRESLVETYRQEVTDRATQAQQVGGSGPLAPLVQMVPENVVEAASNNRNLLQIVFVCLLVGVALVKAGEEVTGKILPLFEAGFALVIEVVDLVMYIAPLGVFALVADTIGAVPVSAPGMLWTLLGALGLYALTLVGGLLVHTFGVYPLVLRLFSDVGVARFFKAMAPAQLVAFSTSSSAATLPVTLEACNEDLEIPNEVTSFVVPLGVTVNMDGTAMFLVVAALFIAQATGTPVDPAARWTVVMMAVLGSIGAVAVPSIGIVFLISIVAAIGAPTAGVALVLSVDRILDMIRTVTNVTGDAVVACAVARSEARRSAPPNPTTPREV
jgi:Na+/H+-dicarboxylate symporter